MTGLQKDGNRLTWKAPATSDPMQEARAYVVYSFKEGEEIDLDKACAIRQVTYTPAYELPEGAEGTYVVTVLDRVNNESPKGTAIKVANKESVAKSPSEEPGNDDFPALLAVRLLFSAPIAANSQIFCKFAESFFRQ